MAMTHVEIRREPARRIYSFVTFIGRPRRFLQRPVRATTFSTFGTYGLLAMPPKGRGYPNLIRADSFSRPDVYFQIRQRYMPKMA